MTIKRECKGKFNTVRLSSLLLEQLAFWSQPGSICTVQIIPNMMKTTSCSHDHNRHIIHGPHVSVAILSIYLSLSPKNKTGLQEIFLLLFLVNCREPSCEVTILIAKIHTTSSSLPVFLSFSLSLDLIPHVMVCRSTVTIP